MTPVSPVQETWLEMIDLSLSSNNNDTGQWVIIQYGFWTGCCSIILIVCSDDS